MASELLKRIYDHQNRTLNAKVVFTDIVSYSKRRSQMQAAVVDAFMHLLKQALDTTASASINYIQSNGINFDTEVIRIPSGDGAAIVFPFEGLHDVHLRFALSLLEALHEFNGKGACDKFIAQGWCNCHPFFNITTGIAEGKVVLYQDLNGNYNIAGNAINMAARVMGMADHNQIIFTDDAYRQIIDMVDDATLDQRFLAFKDARIKHGLKITVYQYVDKTLPYLNSVLTESLMALQRMMEVGLKMKTMGMPMPIPDSDDLKVDLNASLSLIEGFAKLMEGARKVQANIPAIPLGSPSTREDSSKAKRQSKKARKQ